MRDNFALNWKSDFLPLRAPLEWGVPTILPIAHHGHYGRGHVHAHRQIVPCPGEHRECRARSLRRPVPPPDGSFGFEAFRRDVEDGGLWTAVAYHSGAAYGSKEAAEAAAVGAVSWLADALAARARR